MTQVSLFRPEAVDFRRDALAGSLPLPPPPAQAGIAWLLVGAILGIAVFLATGQYARKAAAIGYLTPSLGIAKVLPPRAGVVTAVAVHEGQVVADGAPLVTVRVEEADAHGGDVGRSVVAALERQRSQLLAQIGLEQAKAAAEAAALRTQLADLAAESATLRAELALQRQRTDVAEQQVAAGRAVVGRGDIARVELQRREDNALAQRQALVGLARQIAEKQAQTDQQRQALAQLPNATAGSIATLRGSIAEIDTRLADRRGQSGYLLRAPVAGRVSALQARVGMTVDPAIPLLAIVPQGSALQAELLVPARAIGEVTPGQRVRLAYDAFPFQRFGLQGGRVATVSRTLLRPAELLAPVVVSDPSYRVTVTLDHQDIAVGDRTLDLAPDLTLHAEILFDRRSLLDWLLEPVATVRRRGL